MPVIKPLGAILGTAILIAITASCAVLPRTTVNAPGRSTALIAETARHAQQQFALGNYRKALGLYSHAYDRHHLLGLRQGYLRLGEQIRSVSDEAYERRAFVEAGSAYRALFESGITTRDFSGSLTFTDDYLSVRIRACSKALMEIGLIKYREEKLDEAIAIWKQVLVFDYDNRSARNAIETATVQLQGLKKIR